MSDIAALIETATSTSQGSFRRKMAVADLARSGEPRAIETLIGLLDDEDTYLRREVVSGLAKTEDAAVIEPLIGALDDADDYLQRDAAEALGRFGDRRAIEALRKLLDDDSYSVRYAAERSLKQIEQRQPPRNEMDEPPAGMPETAPESVEAESRSTPSGPGPATPLAGQQHSAGEDQSRDGVAAEHAGEAPSSSPPTEEEAIGADDSEAIVQAMPVDAAEAFEHPSAADPVAVSPPLTSPPAPLVPVATISPIQPVDGIVTAELSTPASDTWPRSSEGQTSERATASHTWDAARRFRMVFGTATTELRDMYQALSAAEESLLESEQEYRRVLDLLGDEQLANRDGLARLEHELDGAAKELADFQRETNRNRRKQYKLEREASTLSFQIASFMSSEKTRQNRETIRKLKSEAARLDAVAAATRTRQEKLQQQYDTLAAPLKQLQQQAEELAETRATGRQAIGDASRRIDTWMSEYLLRLPTEDLRQRIADLAESSPNATVLTTCADELVRAAAELEEHSVALREAETLAEQAVAAAEAGTDALGEAIAAGFRLTSAERRTNVRLSGSLRFSEERGTFGGFSGAEGTARGSGSGQAAYSVDEIGWAATSEFGMRVNAFTDAWTTCGTTTARRELLQVLVAAARRRADDLTRLIRAEVELDFVGGRGK